MANINILVLNPNNRLHPYLACLSSEHHITAISSVDHPKMVGLFEQGQPDLCVVDVSGDQAWHGLAVGKEVRKIYERLPIVILTNKGSEEFALAALRAGISDYLKEPFGLEELRASIGRCLFDSQNQEEIHTPQTHGTDSFAEILIGESGTIKDIRSYLGKVSATESNVLITGETGTGKELVARIIHENSSRWNKPFICVNCAAIPDTLLESELFGFDKGAFTGAVGVRKGKMELAQGGTILFDEIGDMSLSAQAKILRALEERTIYRLGGKTGIDLNLRIIAATNQNPEKSVMEGIFRKDLYYRLNVARIHLPPIRERREDIPLLLHHYLQEFNQIFRRQVKGFTDEAKTFLFEYSWPGNVRELKNLVEATFINLPSKPIALLDLPPQFRARAKEYEHLPTYERDRILAALLTTNWNRNKAADKLQCSRMTLYRKMRKYKVGTGQTSKLNGKNIIKQQFKSDVTSIPVGVSSM